MRKTIILTGLLLIFSLVADFFVNSNAKGSLLVRSYSATMSENDSLEFSNSKINLIDSSFVEPLNLTSEIIDTEILYEKVKGTVYHAKRNQCDDTPLITADNSLIDTARVNDLRWVALSRDLLKRKFTDPKGNKHLWSGKIKLGDTIWIDYNKEDLWALTHPNYNPKDSIAVKRGDFKYEKLKIKYEQIRGYWIVHDVMGSHYYKRNKSGKLILDENGNKQRVNIYNAIDFLQHPEYGMLDMWDRNIIIAKRKVTKVTLPALAKN